MKATSRRRLLVSSIAMLLVAMIALGTATFAWFSTNTQSTASNIAVKTAKQSNLLIAKNNGNWQTIVDYAHSGDNILLPASTTNYTEWFKAEAATYDGGTAKTGGADTVLSTEKNSYYYQEGLHIRNDGNVAVNNVTVSIKFDDATTAQYARVALVEATDKTGASLKGSGDKIVFAPTNGDSANAVKSIEAKSIKETELVTAENSNSKIVATSLAADSEKYYALYVWFEGQDTDCKDSNAGQGVPNITFTVTGTPAE